MAISKLRFSVPHWFHRLGLVAGLLLLPSLAVADDSEKADARWAVFGGVHGTSASSSLGEGGTSTLSSPVMVGLRLWQSLGERLRLEEEVPLGVSKSRDQVATAFFTMPRIHIRYLPVGSGEWTPSLVAGAGIPFISSTKQSSLSWGVTGAGYVGAGLGLRLKRLRIGLDARYVALPGKDEAKLVAHEWEVLITFGLSAKPKKNKRQIRARPSDSDRDGVPDSRDQCLSRKEDRDGFEDEDGCPELDNDRDGVIDGLDECPNEAETFNGFEDDDGCTDDLIEEVRLLEGVIQGLKFDEGSGVMDDKGREELLRLVEVLRDFPSVKVEAIGHGDSQEGKPEEILSISRERAESVCQFFIEQGIGHGRVFSSGRGDSEPYANNDSSRGRKANRRVEVRLLRGNDPLTKPVTPQPR